MSHVMLKPVMSCQKKKKERKKERKRGVACLYEVFIIYSRQWENLNLPAQNYLPLLPLHGTISNIPPLPTTSKVSSPSPSFSLPSHVNNERSLRQVF